jgi:hypothetical protein
LSKKRLAIFEVEGKRGANFDYCYENLNSNIPPGSVEPERSGCRRTVTKLRLSLNDDSLAIFTFLRGASIGMISEQ